MDSANAQPLPTPIVAIDRGNEATVVHLAGELDMLTSPDVKAALEAECARRPARLRVDLSAVEFLDSSALRVFVHVHMRLAADSVALQLVGCSEEVRRLLSLTSLDWLIDPQARTPQP